jgi:cyclopropane-fatty-acyl-phospholipid synthase
MSFLLGYLISNGNIIFTLLTGVAIYILLFFTIEFFYFYGCISVWDEQERVDSSYQWFDVYLDSNGKNKTADLTEGYFKDDKWNITPEKALKQKYDKFYEILDLKPGMKVLDIGCGYGQWMMYLREKGVDSVGLTLANVHVEEGKKNGLDIRLQDGRTMSSNEYGEKFDAVTLLGSLEHFAKCYYSDEDRNKVYRVIMEKSRKALNPNSQCQRIMTTTLNVDNDKWSVSDYMKAYILERFYSGRYPVIGELDRAKGPHLKRIYLSDQTEDYRWMSIINPDHFGNFYINRWTIKRIIYSLYMFFTDPFSVHKWLYHNQRIWMWHLGGTMQYPDRHRYAPCRLKWEAFEALKKQNNI